ncbi:hypothetical protein ACFY2W_26350 [Streptomyces sp. NPDC001262]|uniref:hypothetical protein n=1 Tax=Streptomyces sp. NPDC001262 TaxID=3364552 RepID=UPI0036C4BAF3
MTAQTDQTECSDWGKADFHAIYNCPDPRAYFSTLAPLQYQVPHHAQAVFRTLLATLGPLRTGGAPLTVLDLCCSYGINAALLNHEVTLAELYERYTDGELSAVPAAGLAAADRAYFAERRRPDAVHVVGLDAAPQAVGYARSVGLLEHAFAENLEDHQPSEALRRGVAGTHLITVTGGLGYIFTRTFIRLFDCLSAPPWIAAFVLRTISYQPVVDLFTEAGLVTEKLDGHTFRQRRFADGHERAAAFEALGRQRLDPAGKEDDGYYHADLYLSRPSAEAAALPMKALLPDG